MVVLLPSTIRASQIDDMVATLSHNSPAEFLIAANSNRWTAPIIHSNWFVDRITDPDIKQKEVSIRAFGKLMADCIDTWSKTLREARTPKEIAPLTKNLLALSDWLATANGYGNLTLAFRCQDVASTGLGRLAADLDFPYDEVSGLVVRLQAPWQSSITRAQMLNAEAGTNLFDVSGKDDASAQEVLAKTWQNAQRSMLFQEMRKQYPEVIDLAEGRAPSGVDANTLVALKEGLAAAASFSTNKMDFFADIPSGDYPARPWTTSRLWDVKRHSFFTAGDIQSPNFRKLMTLLRFRQLVGSFPDHLSISAEQAVAQATAIADAAKRGIKIVTAEEAFGSTRKAAFDAAWSNVNATEPAIGTLSCDTYEAVLAGDLVDIDTHEERLTNQRTATDDPNAP